MSNHGGLWEQIDSARAERVEQKAQRRADNIRSAVESRAPHVKNLRVRSLDFKLRWLRGHECNAVAVRVVELLTPWAEENGLTVRDTTSSVVCDANPTKKMHVIRVSWEK